MHRTAAATPSAMATTYAGRTRSWSELKERIARMAGALQALGVKSGDRVAVLAMNSDNYVELYFAVVWAGAVIVPMNIRWSVPEHIYSIRIPGRGAVRGRRLPQGGASCATRAIP
ncbi:MAG: AMP-binding protein [Hyphomonadaceae bacterium]